mgnify:CR=1 FL=1
MKALFAPMPPASYAWPHLSSLRLGRYAEYWAIMEFTRRGLDVYSAEVDDKGIYLILRLGQHSYYDVQVKTARNLSYIFFRKDRFQPCTNLLAAIVLFFEGGPPELYVVPSLAWKKPNALFVDRDYVGKKSAPEYGLALSLGRLDKFRRDFAVERQILRLNGAARRSRDGSVPEKRLGFPTKEQP